MDECICPHCKNDVGCTDGYDSPLGEHEIECKHCEKNFTFKVNYTKFFYSICASKTDDLVKKLFNKSKKIKIFYHIKTYKDT